MKQILRVAADFKHERETQLKRYRRFIVIWTGTILCVSLLLSYFAVNSEKIRSIERRITWPIQFNLRETLDRSPALDQRIHVIMFDDSTVQMLKRSSLNLREWASLLSYLDTHQPDSIYIDKIFGIVDEDFKALRESLPPLRMLHSRVAVGSFTSTLKIPGRDQIDQTAAHFNARNFLPDSYADISEDSLERILLSSSLKDRSEAYAYGPVPELRSLFRQGHIDYPHENLVYPLYRLNESHVLPSLALSGKINLKLESGGLSASGVQIPTTSNGSALVNWLRPEVVYARASTMGSALEAMNSGRPWRKIPQKAHIVILPMAYTGNTDFKLSPYGVTPGGFVQVSLLNSALTKTWLSDFKNSDLFLCLIVFCVALLQFVRGIKAWLFLFFINLAIVAGSILSFVHFSVDVPWLAAAGITSLAGVGTLSIRNIWEMRRDTLLQSLETEFERLEKEEKRLSKEMADAERIALALKPDEAPQWANYWISAFHKSLTEASGDWYFFERSQSGRYGHFVLCDITGHGVQAALVVSCCKTILSSMRLGKESLFESQHFIEAYASRLNSILYTHGKGTHSTTLVGITFDFHTNSIFSVDCGHPFPIVHSSSSSKRWFALLGKVSDPLGFSDNLNLHTEKTEIAIGDCVIVHSDGVPLSRNRRILKRYFEELDSGILISAKRLHDASIKASVKAGQELQEDDSSLVIFRRQA
jgi:serine phosphatase RsbU (regulator of sigma subunit)